MHNHVFRAYDIRGVVGSDFRIEDVYDFARALAFYCIEKNPSVKTAAVGMDGRIHSELIKDELVRGLRESGIDVLFIGQCTSPLLYFSQYWLPVQMGVMVTASHNPREYNGLKMVLDRRAIAREEIQILKHYFLAKKSVLRHTSGMLLDVPLIEQYVKFLKRLFPQLVGSQLPCVFDCANGASGAVIPLLVESFNFSHASILYEKIDGTFPHHEPDPSVVENMADLKQMVLDTRSVVGIGFDGDADRMGAVTAKGQFLSGDRLLGLYTKQLLLENPGGVVVFDSKSSDGLRELVQARGGVPCVAPTGHTFIKEAMEKHGGILGGELSCHFFFKDRYFGFDDGVYAALRLIELLTTFPESLEEQLAEFPPRVASPEIRIACQLGSGPLIVATAKRYFEEQGLSVNTIDGIKIEREYGWGILRSSNTQPVVCLRVESRSQEGLARIREDFVKALEYFYESDFLEKVITW